MRARLSVCAHGRTLSRCLEPRAYSCLRIVIVRDGSAFLHSKANAYPVNVGDIAVLGVDAAVGLEPEGRVTLTTLFLDIEYVSDLVFWHHPSSPPDRLEARRITDRFSAVPVRVLRIGEEHTEELGPMLDGFTALSSEACTESEFARMQALWFSILDVLDPYLRPALIGDLLPRKRVSGRRFAPTREEARRVRALLDGEPARAWSLRELAGIVHLSPRQLTEVFTRAYGRTPLGYLTARRVEEMARLLRETDQPVVDVAHSVGWRSRNRATVAFRQVTGVTPSQYRASVRERAALAPI